MPWSPGSSCQCHPAWKDEGSGSGTHNRGIKPLHHRAGPVSFWSSASAFMWSVAVWASPQEQPQSTWNSASGSFSHILHIAVVTLLASKRRSRNQRPAAAILSNSLALWPSSVARNEKYGWRSHPSCSPPPNRPEAALDHWSSTMALVRATSIGLVHCIPLASQKVP